jgi:hypothetical protein
VRSLKEAKNNYEENGKRLTTQNHPSDVRVAWMVTENPGRFCFRFFALACFTGDYAVISRVYRTFCRSIIPEVLKLRWGILFFVFRFFGGQPN